MSDELHKYPGNLKHHKVDAPARREPLLSDDELREMRDNRSAISTYPVHAWLDGAMDIREYYEAARAKDAELIQRLANDVVELQAAYAKDTGRETSIGNEALKAAIAQGFKL